MIEKPEKKIIEHLAECSISMNIMSKDAKDFRI